MNKNTEETKDNNNEPTVRVCEECGGELVPQGRCVYCPICGWSACTI